MAHLSAIMQCLGVGEQCQGCERDMKRGEQWSAVETEGGEPLGWHCDDCIADWKAGRKIGATTKRKIRQERNNEHAKNSSPGANAEAAVVLTASGAAAQNG